MLRRHKVRLAVSEAQLVHRIRRALNDPDLDLEILVDAGGQPRPADAIANSGSGVSMQPQHGALSVQGGDTDHIEEVEPQLTGFYLFGPSLQRMLDLAGSYRHPILLVAEPGLGAGEFARALHTRSPRRERPFVAVRAAELKSAGSPGIVRALRRADGGTLFVHDSENLAEEDRAVLEALVVDGVLRRPNAYDSPIDVALICRSSPVADTAEAMMTGLLETKPERWTVLELRPLRERLDELRELVVRLVEHFRVDLNRPEVRGFDERALATLLQYDWPNNVTEVIQAVEQAIVATRGAVIREENLPAELHARLNRAVSCSAAMADQPDASGSDPGASGRDRLDVLSLLPPDWESMTLREVRDATAAMVERAYLDRLLDRTNGKIGETAKLAGISPRALYDRMRKHDLRKEDYKPNRSR
jgi:DNA-binding NtrC family response regulator